MKSDLILIGGGGHCKACIDVIEATNMFNIIGILDKQEKIGDEISGYKIIGSDDYIEECKNNSLKYLITVGQIKSPSLRKTLYRRVMNKKNVLATVISPRAYVSRTATVGAGTIVMHDALINAGASIGDNCIVNTKALIEHDCVIGPHCHISTAAVINGGVTIAEETFVGSNAVSVESVSAVPGSFINAGSCFKGN